MKLSLSSASSDRFVSKAMRRVYQKFSPLFAAFEEVEVSNPTCTAILVGVVFDKEEEYFQHVANSDGFFQVLFGCPMTTDDEVLKRAVFERMLKAVRACPLSSQDRASFEALFEDWRQNNLSEA